MSADKGRMLRLDPAHQGIYCCSQHDKGGNGNRCTVEAKALGFEYRAEETVDGGRDCVQ